MKINPINEEHLIAFKSWLQGEGKSRGTIEKYLRDVRAFAVWLGGSELKKENAVAWKNQLLTEGYAPVTVNSMLGAINTFFAFLCIDIKVKFIKIQRKLFREQSKELTYAEFTRLLGTARRLGKYRLELLMETICATGIRVSEVKYITVEAAKAGRATISLKGKVRVILLTGKLCRKLLRYAEKHKIISGEIFLTRSGKGMSRRQIWAEMKQLCNMAGVEQSKVFPHNLRHLFAIMFYKVSHDIVHLADVLGHSSIETTRIYLLSSEKEHQLTLERMQLVI